MKSKIRMTRLIITALIISLAAILTTLAPENAEAAPPQAGMRFDAIDDYVGERLDDLRMPGAALGIVEDGEIVHIALMLPDRSPGTREGIAARARRAGSCRPQRAA